MYQVALGFIQFLNMFNILNSGPQIDSGTLFKTFFVVIYVSFYLYLGV